MQKSLAAALDLQRRIPAVSEQFDYVTLYGLRQRKQTGPGMDRLALIRQERRRVQLVIGLAVFTVLAIAFESYGQHGVVEGIPLI